MAERHDDRPVIIIEKSGGIGVLLAGLAIGAGLGLLLAPQSGEETRRRLSAKAREAREAAEEKFDDLQEAFEDGYERTKASIEEGLASARRRVTTKRDDVRRAADAGRAAVRTARDELERRLAESRSARPEDDGDEDEA